MPAPKNANGKTTLADDEAPRPRKQLHAWISPGAYVSWHELAKEQGTTVSALIEALGVEIGQISGDKVPALLKSAIARSHAVAAERARRG